MTEPTHPSDSQCPSPHPAAAPLDEQQRQAVKAKVIDALKLVYDPEIPINVYDLGLIYDVTVQPSGRVKVEMTLTSPACPVAQEMPEMVRSRVKTVDQVTDAQVDIVWDPPWTPERMSDEAKVALDMFY